jgi:hypothetical protein
MKKETIELSVTLTWIRPSGPNGPYRWGDRKDSAHDPAWKKRNVIYRWVKNSTKEIAIVGETDRSLSERTNNYISASASSKAGETNKKVHQEQMKLQNDNDHLYLEFVDSVSGYDLTDRRQRRLAESLLIGYTRPYLQ